MRIRWPFAGAFAVLILLSAYIGLLPHSTASDDGSGPAIPAHLQPNDKFLHLVTFFFLSLIFYWISDTTRRRNLHLTLLVCTLVLGVGSEIVQGLLPNDRAFDPFDVIANVVGSLGAIGLCSWYHKRMIERRRKARYGAFADGAGDDVELGVNPGSGGEESHLGPQETGVTTLEQEVDNWDENAVDDWDAEDGPRETEGLAGKNAPSEGQPGPTTSTAGGEGKRSD
ncbi:hypothetical protein DTO166G4_6527 [Paecilomyces variotii]|nr:hypothetical protein DTO166G4_6527 [Paecilomyces variotii]KAJ9230372.1 hypothetical protein DTO166G5_7337 [Paecilomyces variotii]KAJ9296374.1 hypothetical protein DTO217A2_8824 [Paecilomyces variotii]KAJ9311541.1 hypothetical protein DTO271D3_8168 [Paecilomyces variotii]KAJ9367666.1 hypothetical protein DTO282E5_7663 [Paecilomyces variotii]